MRLVPSWLLCVCRCVGHLFVLMVLSGDALSCGMYEREMDWLPIFCQAVTRPPTRAAGRVIGPRTAGTFGSRSAYCRVKLAHESTQVKGYLSGSTIWAK